MGDHWHYIRGGNQAGPVSAAELKQLASTGQISPTDLVWKDGLSDWVPAAKVKGLFGPQSEVSGTSNSAPRPVGAISTSCSNCGASLRAGARFCSNCGAPTSRQGGVPLFACPACGRKVSSQAEACPGCGQPTFEYCSVEWYKNSNGGGSRGHADRIEELLQDGWKVVDENTVTEEFPESSHGRGDDYWVETTTCKLARSLLKGG